MQRSAEQNLIKFLRENPEWHNSASLQRMPFKNKNGSLANPRTLVRRLQENAEGDHALLDVKYEGRNTFYRIKTQHIKPIYTYKEVQKPDGTWVTEETKIIPLPVN